jgi:hypothetical protein
MESAPKWFVNELHCIDPTWYVRINEDAQEYEIMKMAEIYLKFKDGTIYKKKEPRVVGSYKHCNYSALTSLRYRKWLGRQMDIVNHPERERKAMKDSDDAKKAKMKEEGNDLVAHGLIEHDTYANKRKQSFSYGGSGKTEVKHG